MTVITKGSVSFNLGFLKFGADFDEPDRQCAWEWYTELSTRVAVTGKVKDGDCTDFVGEIYVESMASLFAFLVESRKIMRQFPVGAMKDHRVENHLGALIHRAIQDILRPFLETWQGIYRHWWESDSPKSLSPFDRQIAFPGLDKMLSEWSVLRAIMRAIRDTVGKAYKLVDLSVPRGD